MTQDSAKDFFISYNKADRTWAEWIAWQLEEAGYSIIIQAWDFRAGSNFVLEMQQAASRARRTIAVLSPEYLASLFTQSEWVATFVQDPTGRSKPCCRCACGPANSPACSPPSSTSTWSTWTSHRHVRPCWPKQAAAETNQAGARLSPDGAHHQHRPPTTNRADSS